MNKRKGLPSRNYAKSRPLLYYFTLRLVFPRLAVDTHDGHHIPLFLTPVIIQDKTPDLPESLRGIHGVAVTHSQAHGDPTTGMIGSYVFSAALITLQ